MKTLANCSPREFLVQTNRIRKAVEKWLSLTKVLEIRQTLPNVKDGATDDERREAMEAQVKKNARAMLDAVLEEHPEETAELLGLICFVEPADLDNYRMSDFLGAFTEIINTPEVIDFFISLAQLENRNIFSSAKA